MNKKEMIDMKNNTKSKAADLQHNLIGVSKSKGDNNFVRNQHPDAQWFASPSMGVFFHFGISTVHGDVDISWGMMAGKPWEAAYNVDKTITPEQYFELAKRFDPKLYNPEQWIKAAFEAGFKYAVLTTKHHDGYALWPSKYGEFGTRTHLGGRDLVKPFIDACRKYNFRVGLYYSPPDWYYNRNYMSFNYGSAVGSGQRQFKDRPHYGLKHEIIELMPKPEGWNESYKKYVRGQIDELLTLYGKIDIIWFDGGADISDCITIDEIREKQPGIIINPRLHGYGDFTTPECHMPDSKPDGWWELCQVWAQGPWWAHMKSAGNYRSTAWFLSTLARVLSWDGHFLANIGITKDGTLPQQAIEKIDELKQWMAYNKDAVTDVSGGPYPEKSNVPVTVKQNKWYLFSLPDFEGDIVLKDVGYPASVRLLRTNDEVEHTYIDGILTIKVSKDIDFESVDVIAVEY